MGYAGYVPQKTPPPKPTEVQSALWQISSLDSLEVLGKLTRNIAVTPSDPKFRKLRLTNLKIREAVVDTPGALKALFAMGWQRDDSDPDALTYPTGRQLTMAQVRLVEEAKDRLRKLQKEAARSKAASKIAVTDEQARVRAQMEADRLERLARGPVSQGSAAQALPTASGIHTARDLGAFNPEQGGSA